MTRLDKAWAVSEIDAFLHATDRVAAQGAGDVVVIGSVQRSAQGDATALAHVVEQIVDRVIPSWPKAPKVATRRKWDHLREWAVRARTVIEREDELREKLGDDAPEMDAGRLHPWVWEAAAPLWRSGHRALAVGQAATRVSVEAQAKSGRTDIVETDLFNHVFSADPPKAEEPRLRVPLGEANDKTFKSVHRGVRSLAEGLYAALRNPLSHEVAGDLDEQEALEQLAAFSLLARWVDAASVETV